MAKIEKFAVQDVDELEGWLLLQDAAAQIGCSRQALHKRLLRQLDKAGGQVSHVRRIGQSLVITQKATDRIMAEAGS